MSDIPEDRLERFQPFTYCGLDHFGPCMIKDGCKEFKRYAVLFSCMSSRAIALETISLLSHQWSILQSPGSSNGLKGSEVWPNALRGDTDAETDTSSSITRIKIKEVPVEEFAANGEL